MSELWIEAANLGELEKGERKIIEHDELRIMLVNLGTQHVAVESLCTHAMFDLDDAEIEGESIICPLHGAHFCLKTGAAQTPPAFEELRTFNTRVRDELIEVQVTD